MNLSHEERVRTLVHRAYERGQARAQIRGLGHPLPDPVDRDELYRWRFEDRVYELLSLSGVGQGEPSHAQQADASPSAGLVHPSAPHHLRVLPGGLRAVEGSAAGGEGAGQASDMEGCEPPSVAGRQPGEQAPHPLVTDNAHTITGRIVDDWLVQED